MRAAPLLALLVAACEAAPPTAPPPHPGAPMRHVVRIAFLHHSTGEIVWRGGVREHVEAWNRARGTDYRVTPITYPATDAGLPWPFHRLARTYPWSNDPHDYWNLWVRHAGRSRDRREKNLDDLARAYDVVVFKHCFPVSRVKPDDGRPDAASRERTLANYRLQYEALRERLRGFPDKRFLVWTAAALPEGRTDPEQARRARAFAEWVKGTWDEPGDNVFVWDFHELETKGGLYLAPEHSARPADGHPSAAFARLVAPLLARRIVDVVEGRGDEGSLTGAPLARAEAP